MDREDPLGHCCTVRCGKRIWKGIKLRRAVLFYVLFVLALSSVYCVGAFSDAVRFIAGGYSPTGKEISVLLGFGGTLLSLFGLVAVFDNNSSKVKVFWYFIVSRLILLIVILILDVAALRGCETYALNAKAVSALQIEVENHEFQHRLATEIPGVTALSIGFGTGGATGSEFVLAVSKEPSHTADIEPDVVGSKLAKLLPGLAPTDITVEAEADNKERFRVTVWKPLSTTGLAYNAALMYLQQHKECSSGRWWYGWKSIFDISLCFYMIFPVGRLWWSLQYPRYLLTFTKDAIFDETSPLIK